MTRSGPCFYSEGIDSCRKLSTVKYWIINWFLSENSQVTQRDKGQMARLSTARDWMEGYKCIFEMKSWPINVLMTWKWGLFQRHVCTIQYIGSYPPPPPGGTTDDVATIPFHLSLSSAALRESPNPIPVHSLMISSHSSVFLSFLLLSLSPAELSSPCPRILRWDSVSLPWLGDHHALQLHPGFCCEPSRLSHGLCRKYL